MRCTTGGLVGEMNFSASDKLGAFGADLAALGSFFDPPWQNPVPELTDADQAFILNVAGFRLRALGRLTEAVQPLQAALEADISLEDWGSAAADASNLSELYLTLGDLRQAVAYAEQCRELADKSGDSFRRMVSEATLADALSQAGRLSEAEAAFRKAERMQKDWQPEYPLLYSLHGFLYCDLLLEQGKYEEVESRAAQTLQLAKQASMASRYCPRPPLIGPSLPAASTGGEDWGLRASGRSVESSSGWLAASRVIGLLTPRAASTRRVGHRQGRFQPCA